MSLEAWYTISIIALVISALMTNRISVDVAMVGGLTLLILGDAVLPGAVVGVPDAIQGFAHKGVMLIGALYVVAAGLQETGGMQIVAARLLGRPKTISGAQFRLMAPVAVMSAFMNNTPIVAMYLPIVNDWARKLSISASKLFIPLSFSSILGGKCTYIGTASNVVIMSMFIQYTSVNEAALSAIGVSPLSTAERFWGIAWLGVPTMIVGIGFIIVVSRWLLPERRPASQLTMDARRYEVEMVVLSESSIVGKSIEEAGLRNLPGLYLAQIERQGRSRAAVSPAEVIRADDRLSFVGVVESVVDLRKIRGLVPATDQVEKVSGPRAQRTLVEAVVSHATALVGTSVRDSQFRTTYNAAIIAVHRNGQHIKRKIGDIVLQAGDTLLLETHPGFVSAYRNSDDFYLVSNVDGFRPVRHERAGVALGILALLVILFTLTPLDQVASAFLCAMLMVGTRCVTGTIARSSINFQILIVIGAALGFGQALTNTGAADRIALTILDLFGTTGPTGTLMAIFGLAAIFAQLINTTGAAVLMFPITMAAAEELNVSPVPFVFTLMIAAGCSFISPVAYQTNLMVYGPGGYRFMDFVRIGIPLTILMAIVCALVAPWIFPFHPA